MRIATWNVNSLKARHDRALAWLAKNSPDVVCLQELKIEEPKYPRDALAALGYTSAINAQKTYNGVAILSKRPIVDVMVGLQDGVEDPQARLIAATIDGVRVVNCYMPNGGEVGSDKWTYKLGWLKRFRAWLDKHESRDRKLAVCGDFNVAPEAIDVHDPAEWEKEVLYHPDARAALAHVAGFGLRDTFREKHPGVVNQYSWWDYRMLGFPKNRGLRIDHVYATPSLADRCTDALIDRAERKGEAPSDHAPVVVTFEL